MLREVLHRLLRRLPLPCVLLREGGHFDLITRFAEGGVWLERDCLRCGRVRRNGQVPSIPMPGPPWLMDEAAATAVAWRRLHAVRFKLPMHIEPDRPWDRPSPTNGDR